MALHLHLAGRKLGRARGAQLTNLWPKRCAFGGTSRDPALPRSSQGRGLLRRSPPALFCCCSSCGADCIPAPLNADGSPPMEAPVASWPSPDDPGSLRRRVRCAGRWHRDGSDRNDIAARPPVLAECGQPRLSPETALPSNASPSGVFYKARQVVGRRSAAQPA